MNKRVHKEMVETIVEKRGWHWALASFAFKVWGETEEMKDEARAAREVWENR
jgi:hypothetical protein